MAGYNAGERIHEIARDLAVVYSASIPATDLPVVGSDSGAMPFQLGGERLVFYEGDVETMVGHIRKLRDDPDLRVRIARLKRLIPSASA